ncbi:unnamed protein product [Arabidopsis halleri]
MKPLASSSLCFCKSDSSSKLRLLLCFYPILTDFDWEESFRAMSPAKGVGKSSLWQQKKQGGEMYCVIGLI